MPHRASDGRSDTAGKTTPWRLEPTLAHGAFGAMGGMQTSATDYAKWAAYLLSAWPPRDDPDSGPVVPRDGPRTRAGLEFPLSYGRRAPAIRRVGCVRTRRHLRHGHFGSRWTATSAYTLAHGGGYPGYGSYVLLLPDHGVGIFAFANRTYAVPSRPVCDAALALQQGGIPQRPHSSCQRGSRAARTAP